MQNDSEHIHDCNHPVRHGCPKICIQTNLGTVHLNSESHNTNTSQMDNCGNHSQHFVDKNIDSASIDESSRSLSLEFHGSATSSLPNPTTTRFHMSPSTLHCIVLLTSVAFIVCSCLMFIVMIYILIVLIQNHSVFK